MGHKVTDPRLKQDGCAAEIRSSQNLTLILRSYCNVDTLYLDSMRSDYQSFGSRSFLPPIIWSCPPIYRVAALEPLIGDHLQWD